MADLVFISHSNRDKSVADAICAELERAGIRCWIAPRDITPGLMWGEAILDGIKASRVMIVVHSKYANRSPQVIREVERAVNGRLLLLQFRLADIPPSRSLELFLASTQWLNAFPSPIDPYLARLPELVRTLLAEAAQTDEHSAEFSAERKLPLTAESTREVASAVGASPPSRVEDRSSPALKPNFVNSPPTPIVARQNLSVRTIASLVAGLSVVGIGGTWAFKQLNREPDALSVPDSAAVSSAVAPRSDSSADSTRKNDTTPRDPPVAPPSTPTPLRAPSGAKSKVKLPGPPQTASSAGASGVRDTTVDARGKEPVKAPALTEPVKTPALTDALAATKANECMRAITQGDASWVRAHYGASLTVNDAANLKSLEAALAKNDYRAALLESAKFAGNVVRFSMRVGYKGNFGPQVSTDVPFEVRMVGDQPQAAIETCRAVGKVKFP